jgi:hypothetical protein
VALGIAGAALLLPPVRRRPAILAGILGWAWSLLVVAYWLRPEGAAAWEGDAAHFYRMADEWPWRPGGWWRYRLLVPALVRLLPWGTNLAYAVLAVLSVAGSAGLLSLLLLDLGYGTAARHAGALVYLASFAPFYNSFNYALPDPAAMAVLLLGCRALVRGRDGELALWLAVGCVTKEVVLFLVPVRWLWARAEGTGRPQALRTALVAAPAAAIFLLLRALPAEAGAMGGLSDMGAWLFPWKHQPANAARLYSPFAAGWALVAMGALRPSRWARAGAAFAILAGLSLLVTDAGRMLVYLAPFAVPLMLDAAGLEPGRDAPTARGVAALALSAVSTRMWEPFLFFWRVPPVARRAAALLLAPVVALLARGLRGRVPGPEGGVAPPGA